MFCLFLDVTWKPVSCPLERRIEELLGTLQPGDGLLVNELSLLGRAKGPWGMSKLDGKGLARGFAQSLCCIFTAIWALPLSGRSECTRFSRPGQHPKHGA